MLFLYRDSSREWEFYSKGGVPLPVEAPFQDIHWRLSEDVSDSWKNSMYGRRKASARGEFSRRYRSGNTMREDGIEAMAICSFLAKLGTSEAIEPFYSLDDLAQTLDFSKIGHAQPKFDEEELKKFNTKLVHNMPYSALKDNFGVSETFWNDVKGNLEVAKDVLLWDNICNKEIEPIMEDADFTAQAAQMLPEGDFDDATFNNWMNKLKETTGRKGKDLFHPIRMALTAQANGPELKTLLPLIGREKAYLRLNGKKA